MLQDRQVLSPYRSGTLISQLIAIDHSYNILNVGSQRFGLGMEHWNWPAVVAVS